MNCLVYPVKFPMGKQIIAKSIKFRLFIRGTSCWDIISVRVNFILITDDDFISGKFSGHMLILVRFYLVTQCNYSVINLVLKESEVY